MRVYNASHIKEWDVPFRQTMLRPGVLYLISNQQRIQHGLVCPSLRLPRPLAGLVNDTLISELHILRGVR